jgi:hypothetical protein
MRPSSPTKVGRRAAAVPARSGRSPVATRALLLWTIWGGLGVRDVETLARVRERRSRRRRSGRPVDGRCLGTSAVSRTPSSLLLRTKLRCPSRCQLRASVLRKAGVASGRYVHIPSCIMRPGALPTPPKIEGRRDAPAGGASPCGPPRSRGRPPRPLGRGRFRPTRGWRRPTATSGRITATPRQQTTCTPQPTAEPNQPPARAFTDARSYVRTTAHLQPSDQPPPALRAASTVHPPAPRRTTHPGPLLPCSVHRRLAPLAHQLPPGLTLQVYLAGRGRGASATRWPPFLESPGAERKTGGGWAAACSRLRRTPRNEHLETNNQRRTLPGQRSGAPSARTPPTRRRRAPQERRRRHPARRAE